MKVLTSILLSALLALLVPLVIIALPWSTIIVLAVCVTLGNLLTIGALLAVYFALTLPRGNCENCSGDPSGCLRPCPPTPDARPKKPKRWANGWLSCRRCGKRKHPHHGRGFCRPCHWKQYTGRA